MQYDSMFIIGCIMMGVLLLAVALWMSSSDWLAAGIVTCMVVVMIFIIVGVPKIDLVTFSMVILDIIGGTYIWNLRMQRVHRNRALRQAKAAEAARAAQAETLTSN